MKKIMMTILAVLTASTVLMAQEKKEWEGPKVGDVSIGITFNPVSLASQLKIHPKAGSLAGDDGAAQNIALKKQMFIMSQDPVAAFRLKYRMAEKWNLRASLGFSGSHINYTEYVRDDAAFAHNPATENKVADVVKSDLISGNVALGAEFVTGKKLKFVMGFNILYALAGGKLNFNYGNVLNAENQVPSTFAYTAWTTLNPDDKAGAAQGIAYARPTETYNSGICHGIGLQMDMGIEWFFQDRISLGAAVTFTPVMFSFQPQTYTKLEGYSSITGKVENYNNLVSPGSWACLYGTENLGFQVSLNYYF